MIEKEFISCWINKISGELKIFPDDFMKIEEYEEITVPQKTLLIGGELFGKIEIISADGEILLQADSYDYAKYLVYAARRKSCRIMIPKDEKEIKPLVSRYEKYLDSILVRLNSEYLKTFIDKNPDSAVNEIFRGLNLVRY